MKQKYVPLEKRSKKQQKEFHAAQRKTWGNISPVTKSVPSAKLYNKKKARQWKHGSTHSMSGSFYANFTLTFTANPLSFTSQTISPCISPMKNLAICSPKPCPAAFALLPPR